MPQFRICDQRFLTDSKTADVSGQKISKAANLKTDSNVIILNRFADTDHFSKK